jgi:hypothetical protein
MFRPPLLSNFISSSFLFILKFLKAMEAPFWVVQNIFEMKRQ